MYRVSHISHISYISYIFVAVLTFVFVYAVLKEREELGCYKMSIAKQCDDNSSVYVINTKSLPNDTIETLFERMESIISYHEKAGCWKRCYILTVCILMIIYLLQNAFCKNHLMQWLSILLIIFAVMYFFFNYINFHHFRNLKNNGMEIITKLKSKCRTYKST
jgi:hypothetical protein